jgi:hypothetical protein
VSSSREDPIQRASESGAILNVDCQPNKTLP